MRNISTLLKILKRERKGFPSDYGLCSINVYCEASKWITLPEYEKIKSILIKTKPKNAKIDYHWFDSDGIERTKFLNKLIKKYERKTK